MFWPVKFVEFPLAMVVTVNSVVLQDRRCDVETLHMQRVIFVIFPVVNCSIYGCPDLGNPITSVVAPRWRYQLLVIEIPIFYWFQ